MVKLVTESDLVRLYEGSPFLNRVKRPEAQAIWDNLPDPQRAELIAIVLLHVLKRHARSAPLMNSGASGDRLDRLADELDELTWQEPETPGDAA